MFCFNVLVICAVALYLYKRRKLTLQKNYTSNEIENGIIPPRPENTENEDNRKMTDYIHAYELVVV